LHASQLVPKYIKNEDMISLSANDGNDKIIAVVPSVLDPQNLGSIIRNSLYFGIDKLVLGSKDW